MWHLHLLLCLPFPQSLQSVNLLRLLIHTPFVWIGVVLSLESLPHGRLVPDSDDFAQLVQSQMRTIASPNPVVPVSRVYSSPSFSSGGAVRPSFAVRHVADFTDGTDGVSRYKLCPR